jgi:hypothetical protein
VERPKREAGREERGCGQGRRDKQTEAVWQEEACSHLETEAGRETESSHADSGTEAGGCRVRQAEVGR